MRFSASTQAFADEAARSGRGARGQLQWPRHSPQTLMAGIIFYAIHSIEMMLMIQGTGVTWVDAQEGPAIDAEGNGNISVTCSYGDGASGTNGAYGGCQICLYCRCHRSRGA